MSRSFVAAAAMLGLWFSPCLHRLGAEDWYASDAAGIAGKVIPRSAAAREEYALSIDILGPDGFPEALRSLMENGGRGELHTLFSRGAELFGRRVILDARGRTRYSETRYDDGRLSVETYDVENRLVEERRREADGTGTTTSYSYAGPVLLRAEAVDDAGQRTAYRYRYDRSGSLRRIEREDGAELSTAIAFPRGGAGAPAGDRVGPGSGMEVLPPKAADGGPGPRYAYETDSRGRVLTERLLDASGAVVSELRNTWTGDRLTTVVRYADGVERRTEYEYDPSGNRQSEKNFHDGKLVRTVVREGDTEVEELYVDGIPIIRARWSAGRKLSEERIGADRRKAP